MLLGDKGLILFGLDKGFIFGMISQRNVLILSFSDLSRQEEQRKNLAAKEKICYRMRNLQLTLASLNQSITDQEFHAFGLVRRFKTLSEKLWENKNEIREKLERVQDYEAQILELSIQRDHLDRGLNSRAIEADLESAGLDLTASEEELEDVKQNILRALQDRETLIQLIPESNKGLAKSLQQSERPSQNAATETQSEIFVEIFCREILGKIFTHLPISN